MKNCSRGTDRCCAPVTGSAPASAVSVLFRSRGAGSPARYSRNPHHCAKEPNKSSNRAAYPSSAPAPQDTAGVASSHTPEQITVTLLLPCILPAEPVANKLPLVQARVSS